MKLILLAVLAFSFSASVFSSTSKELGTIPPKQKKEVIPPGTLKFEDNLYFDQTEISNFHWLEYVYWNKSKYGEKSEAYTSSLPDTNVWGTNGPLVKHYFAHPAYNNYPVVGISYEQATAYCSWRSDRVNEMLFANSNKEAYEKYQANNNSVEIPKVFAYRLPTQNEWEKAANAPFTEKTLRKLKDQSPYNIKHIREAMTDVTSPVTSHWPNSLGFFHLTGNVAEMVEGKGNAKGGSWKHSLEESNSSTVMNYTGPNNWLGFRCVCEKI